MSRAATSSLQALGRLDQLGLPLGALVDLLLDQRPAAHPGPVARRRFLVEDALLQLPALALSLLRRRDDGPHSLRRQPGRATITP